MPPIKLAPGTAAYSDRNPPPSHAQLLKLTAIFLSLILITIWSILGLVNAIVWWMPPSIEQQLGALIVPVYEKMAQPSPTQDKLNQLVDRLEAKLPNSQKERNYQVLYIPESTVNAGALPGDRIILYKGLLKEVQSENELMMVLGHELGHFANRDHLRGLGQGLLLQLAFSWVTGDAGSLSAIAASGVVALSRAKFSQTQEIQADQFGLTLLQSNYGHAAGASDFFARLGQKEDGDIAAMLATHPPSKNRVAALEKLIRDRGYPLRDKSPLPPVLLSD
ncbi:MAG: M48 family metallopeptidase [Leptolyngbyaceae cyanobacterium CSU_1_3]|nr:M48 family metallopeptidase [Leptolyngbyaceae cyanobacterium CSU_1_3]